MANQFSCGFSEEELSKLRDEYSLKGAVKLAQEMSRTRYSIASKASRMGLVYVNKVNLVSIDKVVFLAKAGKKIKEIANDLSVSVNTIWRCCRIHRISIRKILLEVYASAKSNTAKKNYFERQVREAGLEDLFNRCCVCQWYRGSVDFAHDIPQRDKGPFMVGNILPLCPNCHRLFDCDEFTSDERLVLESFRETIRKTSVYSVFEEFFLSKTVAA